MKVLAEKDNADYFIVPSATCDLFDIDAPTSKKRARSSVACEPSENPLAFDFKLNLLRKMYPDDATRILNIERLTEHLDQLIEKVKADHQTMVELPKKAAKTAATPAYAFILSGYTTIKFMVGSDRMIKFEGLVNSIQKNIRIPGVSLSLVSAGERKKDPNDPIAGISGTGVREAAAACDFATFAEGIPEPTAIFTRDDQCTMFHALRKGFPTGDKRKTEPCAPVECR